MTNGLRRLPRILSRIRTVPFPVSLTPIAITSIGSSVKRISTALASISKVLFVKRQKVLLSLLRFEARFPDLGLDWSNLGAGPGNCSAEQIEYGIPLSSQIEMTSGTR